MQNRSFFKSVSTLFAGTAIAQVITFASTPILSRIYTPEDFGQLAALLSIVMILSSVSTAKYELSIPIPESDRDASLLSTLAISIAVIVCIFLLIPAGIISGFSLISEEKTGFPIIWIWLIPLFVLIVSGFNILNYQNIRLSNYRRIAQGSVAKSLVSVLIQIAWTFRFSGPNGLLAGHFTGFIANIILLRNELITRLEFNWKELKRVAKEQRKFPTFSMLAGLANMLTLELNNLLLLALYNPEIVGFYSLASRTLNLPLQLIGRSVGQVFYKDAIQERQQTGRAIEAFKRSALLLTALSLLIAVIIGFFAPKLYSIVFGSNWLQSGEMAQILMFMFATRLVSSSVSDVLNVYGKQKTALVINFILFGNIILCYLIAEVLSLSINQYLTIYSINSGILYLIFLLHYRKIVTSS